MDFSKEIIEFVTDRVGGVLIIAEGSSQVVYADSYFKKKYGNDIVGMDGDSVFMWMDDCPKLEPEGKSIEWEYVDTDEKKYYRFNSAMFEKEGKNYKIHLLTDITEYMGLNRDITKYMSFFRKLSGFQAAVMEKLNDTYYELLPLLTEYFKSSKAFFLLQRDEVMDIITYNKMGNIYSNDRIDMSQENQKIFSISGEDDILWECLPEKIKEVFALNGGKEGSSYRLLVSGDASGQKYAIFLLVWPGMDQESINEKSLKSVIKLYAENGIMREKLVYESEHDGLTGLYNKGKYLTVSRDTYGNLDSIAIFNFDVNNLKLMNDKFGHEAGDRLIIKAANSIRKILNNRVHGYRMGGDEFLVVARNVSKTEADDIMSRWKSELERLNSANDNIDCVVAAGMAYGDKGYDYELLMKEADSAMYQDKKSKKRPGEEIR